MPRKKLIEVALPLDAINKAEPTFNEAVDLGQPPDGVADMA